MSAVVQVDYQEAVETLAMSVSRETWDTFIELPEHLVAAYEEARRTLDVAEAAIRRHVEDNNLQEQGADQ
ncbi:MAG TPA: hypothetical protein VK453_25735 [Micromonosporaceae bacterium]|nr:hypothetical protein [Micromonosporaceae bacterium]